MIDQLTSKQTQFVRLSQAFMGSNICPELVVHATQLLSGVYRLLNEKYESIDLTHKDVYSTNIWPLDNCDPSSDKKQQSIEHLTRELAILGPKVIITLGRHALNSFLPDLRISQVHRQFRVGAAQYIRAVLSPHSYAI